MLALSWYILKVIICSGILFGYYWLLLRNKIFHKYNRFYLMTSVVLSLLLPLIKINFWQQDEQANMGVISVLKAVNYGDEYMENITVTSSGNAAFDITQLYPFAYLLVSLVLLIVFVHTLYFIYKLLKKYPTQNIDTISFINTDAKSTPFSFLNYIFWNHNIDMETITGNHIFKHELAHVQEKHTYDKLFINIVLIFFWCNPFYWLYRKELNMIHEFIADKKAVEDSDTEAFAAMILQATYPQHRFQLTNNFFYSPVKRRLLMLVKNKNTKVNYFGRIMVLPLAFIIFAAFTFKVKTAEEKKLDALIEASATTYFEKHMPMATGVSNPTPAKILVNTQYADTNYFKSNEYKTKALIIIDDKEVGNYGMEYVEREDRNYGTMTVYNPAEAKKKFGDKGKYGVITLTHKPAIFVSGECVVADDKNQAITVQGMPVIKGDLSDAIIKVDGKLFITADDLNAIDPNKIKSIDIVKGSKFNSITDAKAKTTMIYITLKPDDIKEVVVEGRRIPDQPVGVQNIQLAKIQPDEVREVVVTGKKTEPLYVLDNVVQEKGFNLSAIKPENIAGIQVLKDQHAIAKYGEEAKNGVVEITRKQATMLTLSKPQADNINIKLLPTGRQWKTAAGQQLYTDTLTFQRTDNKVFIKTEIDPSFPGGKEAWKNYLIKNVNPDIPVAEGWKPGIYTVVVQFIVHDDGTISDISTINYQGSKTAQHCIDLIKKGSNWIPAMQNGIKVNAYRKQPITFVVEEPKKVMGKLYSVPLTAHLIQESKLTLYNMQGNGSFDAKAN